MSNNQKNPRTIEAIQILNSVAARYKQPLMSDNEISWWLEDLRELCLEYGCNLDDIKEAFRSHMRDPKQGSFMPKLSDVVRHIRKPLDGLYPSSNEAWAIALQAQNEKNTIVWTQLMAEAFFCCKPVLDLGDKIGARMAFISAYERLVTEDKHKHRDDRKARWIPSLGTDADMREHIIKQATNSGLLQLSNESNLPELTYSMPPEVKAEVFAKIESLTKNKKVNLNDDYEIKRCPKQPPMPVSILKFTRQL
jgi:hypothetical protein